MTEAEEKVDNLNIKTDPTISVFTSFV